MRKIILFSLVSISSHLMAQKSFFGVDAGVNVANQRRIYSFSPPGATYVELFTNVVRPTFGLFYQAEFSDALALRMNVCYMGLGYQQKVISPTDLYLDYLSFPVNVHYKANKHLSLFTGPYLSFTIGGTHLNNKDVTKTYHKNDYGFSFGVEHDIYKDLAFSVAYYVGLMNIWLADTSKDNTTGIVTTNKYTNRALQFTLIYKFKKP